MVEVPPPLDDQVAPPPLIFQFQISAL